MSNCKYCGGVVINSRCQETDCGFRSETAADHKEYLMEKIKIAVALQRHDLVLQATKIALDLENHTFEDVRAFAELVNAASWNELKKPGHTMHNTPGFRVVRG